MASVQAALRLALLLGLGCGPALWSQPLWGREPRATSDNRAGKTHPSLGQKGAESRPASTATPAAPNALPKFSELEFRAAKGGVEARFGKSPWFVSTLSPSLLKGSKQVLRRALPKSAAAVLVEVQTGRVLSLLAMGPDGGRLLTDALAPAASVFKLVTTAALYEHTDVEPRTRVCTSGGKRLIEYSHLEPAQGKNVVCSPFSEALAQSRNAAFAQLASRKLLPEDLMSTAEALGFNRHLAIELQATGGSLSLPEDELAYARTAAGFENSRLSVLGAANLALTVATGGEEQPMSLMQAPETPSRERRLSVRTARRLSASMEHTVSHGTARLAFHDESGRNYLGKLRAAGKTGTLQLDKHGPTTSWFTGFAPVSHPQVAVAVVLQNGEVWHQKGNQVARDLLRLYFSELGTPGVSSPLPGTDNAEPSAIAKSSETKTSVKVESIQGKSPSPGTSSASKPLTHHSRPSPVLSPGNASAAAPVSGATPADTDEVTASEVHPRAPEFEED